MVPAGTALKVRTEASRARLYFDGVSGLAGSDGGIVADKQLIFRITTISWFDQGTQHNLNISQILATVMLLKTSKRNVVYKIDFSID